MRVCLLTLCITGLCVTPIEAQAFRVRGQRALAFGTLIAGVPEHVLPTDPTRSGLYRLQGPRNNLYVLTFTLPGAMVGPGAALLNMSYSTSDAGISRNATGPQTPFDPNAPYTFTMPSSPARVFVFLGATANPTVAQPQGDYTATVTLTADCAAC